MRATSSAVLALLIGGVGAGQAQPGGAAPSSPARISLPEGADEGTFRQHLAVPHRTGALAAVDQESDQADASQPAGFPPDPFRSGLATSGPAAESFDAPQPGNAGAPLARSKPATPLPVAAEPRVPPAPAMAAAPMPAASAAAPAMPDAVAPIAAAGTEPKPPVAPPASTPSAPAASAAPAPSSGDAKAVASPAAATPATAALDPTALAAALTGFVAETPADDTPAQAAERRAQREAIGAVYAARQNAPFWVADGKLTRAATAVEAQIATAAEDGLDLSRVPVPAPKAGDAASLAATELALSEAAVAYARQAAGSRVNVAKLGGLIDFRPDLPDAARVLGTVPMAAEAGVALAAFNPPQPGYAALKEKLADLRRESGAQAAVRIPYGPTLKPGMSDPRVPLLRVRFHLDEPIDDPLVYDLETAAAVGGFQRANHMPASGILSVRTVAALGARDPASLEGDLIANMELWRWMPREMAADRIEVNIPDYRVRVLRNGVVAHETRVVVGQPDKPTPVFAEQMKFIIVNPYWNVPLSIIKSEMMPKLAADPSYFADHGYEVVERDGVTYVRQPPGDGNALGRIKFMFPNSHAVYLHDTNARSYFTRDMRALSHGCVRVEQPFSFAEAVMGRENGWSEARIKKLIGGQERTINLPKPLPILITYFTAFVDPQDVLQTRDDVYGYTAKVKVALGLAREAGASAVSRSTKRAASTAAKPAKRAAAGATPVVR